jgi:glutamate:GABA antiporter
VAHGSWLALADDTFYNGAVSLAILWFATLMNIVGLEKAKWLLNAGGIATWLVGALILCGGVVAWYRFGAATRIAAPALLPDLHSLATLASFATIALAYSGLELGPVLGGEIRDPRRTIPRALLIACIMISVLYIAGTAALFAALPADQINSISGVPQSISAVAARVGAPALGVAGAVLLTVASVGGLGAWVTGTARLPFLFGLDRYLPKSLGAVHPKFGSPHVALLTQGGLATVVLLAAISGSAVREAYTVLIDMTVILTFLPLLYMFAALPILRRRAPGGQPGVMMIPGGPLACWCVAGSGFAVTLLAVLFAMVPPAASTNRTLFTVKVVGGSALLVGAGLVFYFRGRSRSRGAASP